jgi:hypothetical protein
VFWPTPEIYRMPYHDLIPILRHGLESIRRKGVSLESQWEASVTKQHSKQPARERESGIVGRRLNQSPSQAESKASITKNSEALPRQPDDSEWLPWMRKMAQEAPSGISRKVSSFLF